MNLPVPTFQPDTQTAGRRLDVQAVIRDLLEATLRRPRLALAGAGVVASLVLAGGLLQPRFYTSTAALMIGPRAQPVAGGSTLTPVASIASALVDSEIEIIRSPQIAGRLVDQLNLTRDRAWGGLPGAAPISARRRERVITNVRRAIRVHRHGSTYLASVSATARAPAHARQMVTTLIELHFVERLQRSMQGMGTADRWMTQRLDQLRAELRAREQEIETLRAGRGFAAAEAAAQQIPATQAAVLAARANLAEKVARQRQAPTALQSNTIRELRAREAEAALLEVELTERYGDQHPKLQAARAERESVRAQIQSEISRTSARLNNEVEAARLSLAALEAGLDASGDENARDDETGARLSELERDAAAARALYQSYLLRQHEIAQGRLRPTTVAQVTPASMPVRPNPFNVDFILLLAIVFGIPAGVGLAYLVTLADRTLHDLGEVERELGQPGLVAISDLPRSALRAVEGADHGPAGYVAAKPSSAFAEAFRLLQKSIFSTRDQQGFVVAITSALSEEGKTSTSLGLARTVAISGKGVLLINCDARRRTPNGALRLTPLQGLGEVLSSATPWSDVVIVDGSGAHILPLSLAERTPSDMFGSPEMQTLLSELREAYELVVLDCAPILAVAETRSVVRLADATIVVARAGKTPKTAVASAIGQVQQAGGAVLGVALNGVRPHRSARHFLFDLRDFRIVDKTYRAEAA